MLSLARKVPVTVTGQLGMSFNALYAIVLFRPTYNKYTILYAGFHYCNATIII